MISVYCVLFITCLCVFVSGFHVACHTFVSMVCILFSLLFHPSRHLLLLRCVFACATVISARERSAMTGDQKQLDCHSVRTALALFAFLCVWIGRATRIRFNRPIRIDVRKQELLASLKRLFLTKQTSHE